VRAAVLNLEVFAALRRKVDQQYGADVKNSKCHGDLCCIQFGGDVDITSRIKGNKKKTDCRRV